MTVEQLSREAERLGSQSDELFDYLWGAVQELVSAGIKKGDLVAVLNDLYQHFGKEGLDDAQDQVAEVLNSLTGYCSPSARLGA